MYLTYPTSILSSTVPQLLTQYNATMTPLPMQLPPAATHSASLTLHDGAFLCLHQSPPKPPHPHPPTLQPLASCSANQAFPSAADAFSSRGRRNPKVPRDRTWRFEQDWYKYFTLTREPNMNKTKTHTKKKYTNKKQPQWGGNAVSVNRLPFHALTLRSETLFIF